MATTTIPWGDGSGDNIYLTYPSASGDQTVEVTSDANTGSARSKTVTFSASGVSPVSLTINQAAGGGGGELSDYVQSGLVLHMDGKSGKTGNTSWESVVGNHIFTNYGATFNDDNVQFDGDGQYLENTSFVAPGAGAGTIEVVCDMGTLFQRYFIALAPNVADSICFAVSPTGKCILRATAAASKSRPKPTLAKASFSISDDYRQQNGENMAVLNNSNMARASSTYNYIGRTSKNYTRGKLFSLRVYNRKLTEAEILQNLAVDNIRFNLGLTL